MSLAQMKQEFEISGTEADDNQALIKSLSPRFDR